MEEDPRRTTTCIGKYRSMLLKCVSLKIKIKSGFLAINLHHFSIMQRYIIGKLRNHALVAIYMIYGGENL